jgi:hypothetical protein
MALLVTHKGREAVFVGVIVDQLMAGRTQEHQIVEVMDVLGTLLEAARAIYAKSHHVSKFRKIALVESDMVLKQVALAAVELTAPAGPCEKQDAIPFRNSAIRDVNGGGKPWLWMYSFLGHMRRSQEIGLILRMRRFRLFLGIFPKKFSRAAF